MSAASKDKLLTARQFLRRPQVAVGVGAGDPLCAKLIEEAGFDFVWSSSLCVSATYAVPDANLISMSQYCEAARAMNEVVSIPVIAARRTAAQQRIAALETALTHLAAPLPITALLDGLSGVGRTLAAIFAAEIGAITWFTKFSQLRKLAGLNIIRLQSGQWAGTARISRCGRPLLCWALYQAALGACRTPAWRAQRAALLATRQGDPHAFFKANVELAAKLLRLVWGVWRSGRPYTPARALPAAA